MELSKQRLINHIRSLLVHRWDPLGVRDDPAAHAAYDPCIPGIVGALAAHADPAQMAQHLAALAAARLGRPGDRDHALAIAHELLAAYHQHHPPMDVARYARVRLVTDRYRDAQAPCGSVGFIIEIYSPDAYEVECSRADGTTYAQIVVHPSEIILDEPRGER